MKKLEIILATICFFSMTALSFSQQLPISSQFYWNDYVTNPAYTGMKENPIIMASVRSQWVGFEGAPGTYTLGGHGFLNKQKMGLGGMVFNDDRGGAISQTGVMLNYSYLVEMNEKSYLSFGIAGMFNQYAYDGSDITLFTQDPYLTGSAKQIVPDINFGVLFMYEKILQVGVSVNQLIGSRLKKLNDFNPIYISDNRLIRHYQLTATYKVDINENIDIEPYMLLRSTFVNPIQFELGTRSVFKNRYFAGFGFRYQDAFTVMAGVNKNQFTLGYSYDLTTSKLRNYSTGSHEIMLAFRLK